MPIRQIVPPKTITITLSEGKTEDFPFSKFLDAMLNLPEWGKSWKSVKYAMEIEKAYKAATGGPFELSETPFDKLKQVVEDPGQQGYPIHPMILRQIGAYFEAIIDAAEKE